MKVYLGIDGGGTSTRVVAADATGKVVGVGRGGASNPNEAGVQGSSDSVRQAVEQALAKAKLSMSDVGATFIGMAGVVGAEDQALARQVAEVAGVRGPIGIDHDIRIALAGGLAGKEGLALIVGTGSSCYGRTSSGTTWQAGGWGSVLDDGGSGFGLGMGAMKAAVRIADGRLPESPILPEVMKALGLQEIRQIVRKVYHTGISKTEVGQLAPIVVRAWESGDRVATDLIDEGVRELVWIVTTAADKLKLTERTVRVSTSGGLIENVARYRERIYAALRAALPPGCEVGPAKMAPVLGAVILAYEQAGLPAGPEVAATLQQSYAEVGV